PHEEAAAAAQRGLLGRMGAAIAGASERLFDGLVQRYDTTLRWVLAHRRTTLFVTAATVALTAILAVAVPKGFFPQQDTGALLGVTEAAPDVSFERLASLQRDVADVVRQDPDVESVASFIGSDGTNTTTNSGRLTITLKPRASRGAGAEEVIARVRAKAARV